MNVFDLQAKINLDKQGYEKSLTTAGKSFGEVGNKIKAGAETVAKVSTAALGVAAAGVTALVKQSVSAYADYEQLVGGIETLFGDSANKVIANAEKAFSTAGMSVNEYMETSIQSAASLISALDGDQQRAAELMDMSIVDMSDNVNKMGTTMEAVQNAYRGFSRQNFTMLDNLALGFSGTKEGMQELLDKAQQISGVQYDISSYADIVQAIHVVQEEMGITGTTAKEAAGTITGSISSVKAAWKNVTVEMAKADGDVGGAFQILGDTVGAVVDNMLPRVEKALGGVGDLITAAAPDVISGIQKLLPKVMPSLLKTAGNLTSNIGATLLSSLPEAFGMGRDLLASIASGMDDFDFGGNGILGNILDTVVDNAPDYFKYGEIILSKLADQLLNVDYAKLGSSMSSVFTSAVNSATDFIKDVDFYKVGENIADFLNSIDWQTVANSVFDLLAAGIKALPDIAVSFFANADLGNLMTMIGLLSAPKLLGGLTDFIKSEDGQSEGKNAGMAWSKAFMYGLEAFGLGWAIGSYLRDNIEFGGKTLGEWIETGMEKVFGEIPDEDAGERMFETIDGRKALMYDSEGNYTQAYLTDREKRLERQKEAWSNFDFDAYGEYMRQNFQMPKYADGGRVEKPTIALVGEKEPEYIIPESKMDKVYSRSGGDIHIENLNLNISGSFDMADPLQRRQLIEEISHELRNLNIREVRAQGGVAW